MAFSGMVAFSQGYLGAWCSSQGHITRVASEPQWRLWGSGSISAETCPALGLLCGEADVQLVGHFQVTAGDDHQRPDGRAPARGSRSHRAPPGNAFKVGTNLSARVAPVGAWVKYTEGEAAAAEAREQLKAVVEESMNSDEAEEAQADSRDKADVE